MPAELSDQEFEAEFKGFMAKVEADLQHDERFSRLLTAEEWEHGYE